MPGKGAVVSLKVLKGRLSAAIGSGPLFQAVNPVKLRQNGTGALSLLRPDTSEKKGSSYTSTRDS